MKDIIRFILKLVAKSYCISNFVVWGGYQGILGKLDRRTCK